MLEDDLSAFCIGRIDVFSRAGLFFPTLLYEANVENGEKCENVSNTEDLLRVSLISLVCVIMNSDVNAGV